MQGREGLRDFQIVTNSSNSAQQAIPSGEASSDVRSEHDQLGLVSLVARLIRRKWLIIGITAFAAVFSVYYSLQLRNLYRAQVTLARSSDGASLSKLGGGIGGLANLVGIDISTDAHYKSTLALKVLESRQFVLSFVERRQILVPLLASKHYDRETRQLSIDPKLFDTSTGRWTRVGEDGIAGPPSKWVVYESFLDLLEVETDNLTGITTIAVDFYSPDLAAQWANWLVEDLNDQMRSIDAASASASIRFLKEQTEQTSLVGLQEAFYRLIEEQTKNLMLTHVEAEYVFKVIDQAVPPELKTKPRRALICIAMTIGGFCFAVLLALSVDFFKGQLRLYRLVSSPE